MGGFLRQRMWLPLSATTTKHRKFRMPMEAKRLIFTLLAPSATIQIRQGIGRAKSIYAIQKGNRGFTGKLGRDKQPISDAP